MLNQISNKITRRVSRVILMSKDLTYVCCIWRKREKGKETRITVDAQPRRFRTSKRNVVQVERCHILDSFPFVVNKTQMKKKTPKWKCARKCQATRKITNRCDCQHTGSPPISPLRFPFLFYFFWWPWHESSRQKNVIQVPLLYVNQETVDFIFKNTMKTGSKFPIPD